MQYNDFSYNVNKHHKTFFNKEVIFTIVSVFLLVLTGVSSSVAIFTDLKSSTNYNNITVGTLDIAYDDISNGLGGNINLTSASKVTDENALSLTPYKFKLTNNGNINAEYKISIANDSELIALDGCEDNLISYDKIKFLLIASNGEKVGPYLLSYSNFSSYIKSGILAPNESITFQLRIWIDNGASLDDYVDKHFHGKVSINSSQVNTDYVTLDKNCLTYSTIFGTITNYSCDYKNIIIPAKIDSDNITQIGTAVFKDKNLEHVIISDGITTINQGAFENNKLTEIEIPASVTNIDASAFKNNNLKVVSIYGSPTLNDTSFLVNSPGSNMNLLYFLNYSGTANNFSGAIGLNASNSVTGRISTSNTYVLNKMDNSKISFEENNETLTNYTSTLSDGLYKIIPTIINGVAVKNIGNGVQCLNTIASLYVPDSVTTIKDNAFLSSGLSSVYLSSNLTSIGNYAFKENYLTNINVPDTVTSIGTQAFLKTGSSNTNLSNIYNNSITPFNWIDITGSVAFDSTTNTITNENGNILVRSY